MKFKKSIYLNTAALALAAGCCTAASATGEPYAVAAASYPGPTQVTVNWASDGADVQAFKVERRILGSRAWQQAAYLPDGSARSFVDANLRYDTAYEYRVSAYRADAPATALPSVGSVLLNTPSQSATQPDYDAAAVPRNVDVQPLAARSILVSWTDVTPDETGFKVERRLAPGGSWLAITSTPANVRLYRDDAVQPATAYEYRISADRPGMVSIPSAPKTGTTPSASTAFMIKFVDGATGIDTNPGTEALPYKTIQRALEGDSAQGSATHTALISRARRTGEGGILEPAG